MQAERLHELAFELEESIGGFNLDGSQGRRRSAPSGAGVPRPSRSRSPPARPLARGLRSASAVTRAPWRSRPTSSPASRADSQSTPGSSSPRGSSRRAPARGSRRSTITPSAYVELIGTRARRGRARELVEAVRVGESRLFRHRSQIAALIDVVVPALAREAQARTIRVWSAGCASGEEPYTLAIVLSRALPGVTVSIVATDVSDDALEVAAARRSTPRAALDDVPDGVARRLPRRRTTASACVRRSPRLVTFERANLLERTAAPARNCDSCGAATS